MKHPVALALAAAFVLAGLSLFSLRVLAPSPGTSGPGLDAVDLGRVWGTALPDLADRRQPLSQWQGKVLVLNFWAPWCPPCREEIPGFMRLQDRYGKQGLQFVGVALDTPDKVRAYADETGMDYPLLLGGAEALELARVAGNRMGGLPYTLVLNRQGAVAASHTGAIEESRLEGLLKPLL